MEPTPDEQEVPEEKTPEGVIDLDSMDLQVQAVNEQVENTDL